MIIALLVVLLAEPVKLPGTIDLANAKDPISGVTFSAKKIAKFHVDWKGVRVWFETGSNAGKFRKEPTKYLKALGIKWDKAAKVLSLENTKCPVAGKPVKREQFADKNGVRVYTCCARCKAKLWNDPAKTVKTLGYKWVPGVIDLKNDKCPITDEQLYPEAPIWVDIDGIRVRVCCDKCGYKAKKDAARTFRLLGVEPKKLKAKLNPKAKK